MFFTVKGVALTLGRATTTETRLVVGAEFLGAFPAMLNRFATLPIPIFRSGFRKTMLRRICHKRSFWKTRSILGGSDASALFEMCSGNSDSLLAATAARNAFW